MSKYIKISIAQQMLFAYESHRLVSSYAISSAKNGIGQRNGSGCTPLGKHGVYAKIGEGAPINSVFVARQLTGEIYTTALGAKYPHRDWILSRIIWLAGAEQGFNLGANVEGVCDTKSRYIYIHGSPDELPMRIPLSHGCIRMRNRDVIKLYDWVDLNTVIHITN